MAQFEWNNSYSVGVPTFDDHHKILFDIMNELEAAMANGNEAATARAAFKRLLDYTRYHFAAEEEAMIAAGYPNFGVHKFMHEQFIGQLMQACMEFQKKDGQPNNRLSTMLQNWLRGHIKKHDMDYTEHMRRAGIAHREEDFMIPEYDSPIAQETERDAPSFS